MDAVTIMKALKFRLISKESLNLKNTYSYSSLFIKDKTAPVILSAMQKILPKILIGLERAFVPLMLAIETEWLSILAGFMLPKETINVTQY